MPSSDNQYRLNSRQRREIDQIGEKFHFNLAPPPRSLDEITTCTKFVSLTDFIDGFGWQYSDLDIVDRREIKHLAAENFWPYIAKSEVPGRAWPPFGGDGGQRHRVRSEFARMLYRRIRRLEPGVG
jgi:hypothetical protein